MTAPALPTGASGSPAVPIQITYLGGGSLNWAHALMRDLAMDGRLTGKLVLHDIDHTAALANVERGTALFARTEAKGRFTVEAEADLHRALSGADVVVISILPGPMELMVADLDVCERHGVIHTVGDTTGPAGIMRALRAIPLFVQFARAIMARCPMAWVVNYTNPMTVCTAAMHAAAPGIRAFGCCHEVFGTQWFLAKLAGQAFGCPPPDHREIAVEVTGVNHFTWITSARWAGHDLFPLLAAAVAEPECFTDQTAISQERIRDQQWFTSSDLVKLDLFRRFGALGAAGDRHLVEFLPWYLGSDAELNRWGVVRTPSAWRLAGQRSSLPRRRGVAVDDSLIHGPLKASGEEGVGMLCGLLGLGDLVTNVNLPNQGQCPDLPEGAVVETNARFSRDRLTPLVTAPLPVGAGELVRRITRVQHLTLEGAMSEDPGTAFQAILLDPLVHLPTEAAQALFDDLRSATAEALPPGLRPATAKSFPIGHGG